MEHNSPVCCNLDAALGPRLDQCLRRRPLVFGQLAFAVHWPWPINLQVLLAPRLQRKDEAMAGW